MSEGLGVLETAVKEAAEEANVPEDLAVGMKAAGSVSFFHQSERGIHPNTEFVFDLELPETFQPNNNDGEVDDWKLVPVEQVLEIIASQVLGLITLKEFNRICLGLQDNQQCRGPGLSDQAWPGKG